MNENVPLNANASLHQFVLHTDRLTIRPMTLEDLDAVELIMNAGFGESPREEHENWLRWSVMNYAALHRLSQPPYGEYAIDLKEGGAMIGLVGIVPSFGPFDQLPYFRAGLALPGPQGNTLHRPEVGLFWCTHPDYRSIGIASEAAGVVITHLFKRWKLHRVVATTEYDNAASMRVMHRLGMTIERNPYPEPVWFQVVGILENRG